MIGCTCHPSRALFYTCNCSAKLAMSTVGVRAEETMLRLDDIGHGNMSRSGLLAALVSEIARLSVRIDALEAMATK